MTIYFKYVNFIVRVKRAENAMEDQYQEVKSEHAFSTLGTIPGSDELETDDEQAVRGQHGLSDSLLAGKRWRWIQD